MTEISLLSKNTNLLNHIFSVQPKITFLEGPSTTEMDEKVRLTCEAIGDPTPTITWSFSNRVFNEGEQVTPNAWAQGLRFTLLS